MKYIILAMSAVLLTSCSGEPKTEQPAKVAKTPEQIQAEQAKKEAEAIKRKNEEMIKKANEELGYVKPEPPPITVGKDILLASCQTEVQKHLKDPKSFDMNRSDYRYIENDEDLRITFDFRATNAYNAVVKQNVICVFGRDGVWRDFEIR